MQESLELINQILKDLHDRKFWGKFIIDIQGGKPSIVKLEESIVLSDQIKFKLKKKDKLTK